MSHEDKDALLYLADVRIDELSSENAKLKEENAKLRKLVRDAWGGGHPERSCAECDIADECFAHMGRMRWARCLFETRIEERMRELGIEVDG